MRTNTENLRQGLVAFFWTVVIIYLTDTLIFATNNQNVYTYVKRFGVILLAGVLFLQYATRNGGTMPRKAIPLLVVSMSIFISMFLNGMSYGVYAYITMVFTLWFGYWFSKKYTLQEFSYFYCRVMLVISIASLICYFAGNVLANVGALPTITNKAGYLYKTIYLSNIPLRESLRRRNGGPFWEPGVYQTYLNTALILTLFVNKDKNKVLNVVTFIITALSTLSGAALIPMLLIIAAYFFENHNMKSFLSVFGLLLLVVVLMNTGMFDEIIMKMTNAEGTTSFGHRISSIYGNLKGFIQNPIFGSSPEELNSIRSEYLSMYVGNGVSGSTNTYLTYLSMYGVFVGAFMLWNMFQCVRSFSKSRITSLLIFMAIIVMTSNENLSASLLICTLTFLRYKNTDTYLLFE